MGSSSGLIPILIHPRSLRCSTMRRPNASSGGRAILHVRGLTTGTNSRALSSIALSGISRRSVGGQRIGVLLSVGASGLGLALPELAFGGASCVAVVGAGAEGFLFLVVAGEDNVEEDGEEEENGSDDGDGEAGSVESASSLDLDIAQDASIAVRCSISGIRIPTSKRRLHIGSLTAARTVAGGVRNINKRAGESQVKECADEAEEDDTAQAANQESRYNRVQDGGARDTLNSPLVGRDVQVMIAQSSQEVRKDAQDHGRAAKLNETDHD